MAIGDVVSQLNDVGAASTLDFQPAAGVEIMISQFFSENGTSAVVWRIVNGTLNLAVVNDGSVITGANQNPLKLFITNTIFIRDDNTSGAAVNMGFTGMQIK